ncbi:MAG: hypothetical protein KDK33_06350 [Leptospiraceae bacterium]|nr:hypothetical protein [Leptospiraceae bacterium]
MNIYVNDQKLDASLNEEKTLREVYDAIEKWSKNQNHYIMNLKVDDRDVSPSALEEVALDDVNRLDFVVADQDHFIAEAAHELDRYLDQAGSFLYGKEYLNESQVADLKEGYGWIEQATDSLAGLLGLDLQSLVVPMPEGNVSAPIAHTLNALKQSIDTLENAVQSNEPQSENIAAVLIHMRPLKSMSMRLALQLAAQNAGLEELSEALEQFESKLPAFKKEIVATNEAFQSGKEGIALELLDSVVERLQGFMSCLFALEARCRAGGMEDRSAGGQDFDEVAQQMMELLKDLSSALEENDITAAGDILEYELTEKLDAIQPFPSMLRNFVASK